MTVKTAGIVAAGTMLLVACATVPITDRSQLSLVSDAEMIRIADQQFAAHMIDARRRGVILSPSDSPEAADTIARVRRVADEIIDAAGMRGQRAWEVVVIKEPSRNAAVLPNGKIFVLTGLLPVAGDDAGLAAVLGHEVGHVVGRHGAERMSQALLTQLAVLVLDVVVAVADPRYRGLAGNVAVLGTTFGLRLPFSRHHESEADRLGMVFMAKAGYDPAAAVAVWDRMQRAEGSSPPEFFSTHPSPATRSADLQRWLPEAQRHYAQRPRPEAPTRPAVAPPGEQAPPAPAAAEMPPAAMPTLEAKLAEIEALRARGAITEEERAILRRRVVETVALAPAAPALAAPARPSAPSPAGLWVLGRWSGQHLGAILNLDRTEFEFIHADGQVRWHMWRRTQIRNWIGTLTATGGVRYMTEELVALEGTYDAMTEGGVAGKPIEYTLTRRSDTLDGIGAGAVDLLRVSLRRR